MAGPLSKLGPATSNLAVALAQAGCEVFASDIAPNGLKITQNWLDELGLHADLKVSDMTICPWPENNFHGVISWNSLQHNTLDNIKKAVNEVHKHLVPGGLFLGAIKSTKADSYGMGHEIEPDTFVQDDDKESGVPHHFFDEEAIKELFKDWEFISLAEQVMHYVHRGDNFRKHNPFSYTHWCILARKK